MKVIFLKFNNDKFLIEILHFIFHQKLLKNQRSKSDQCIIGSANECLINESTRRKRGDLESIPYGDQILRVRYSGPDNILERFSITSIDPIVGK